MATIPFLLSVTFGKPGPIGRMPIEPREARLRRIDAQRGQSYAVHFRAPSR